MANRIVAGIVAGAAGTVALNVTTYLDMLVRGRPPSGLPAKVAGALADEVGLPLDFDSDDGDGTSGGAAGGERGDNRREAIGALLGYANGVGIGLAYGVSRLVVPRLPIWAAGTMLGSAAMAASDVPATRLGLTDPRTWQPVDWAADVVPHLVYGTVTAVTFEALRG